MLTVGNIIDRGDACHHSSHRDTRGGKKGMLKSSLGDTKASNWLLVIYSLVGPELAPSCLDICFFVHVHKKKQVSVLAKRIDSAMEPGSSLTIRSSKASIEAFLQPLGFVSPRLVCKRHECPTEARRWPKG